MVALRDVAVAEVHQPLAVDAGDRRVAVDDGRQHREALARTVDLDVDARGHALAGGKVGAAGLDGDALAQLGQKIGDQGGDIGPVDLEAAHELLVLARCQLALGDDEEPVPLSRQAVGGEYLIDGRRLLELELIAGIAAPHHHMLDALRFVDGHGYAVETHILAIAQAGQHAPQLLDRQQAARAAAERHLDREILGGDDDRRPARARSVGQRGGELGLRGGADDDARELEARLRAGEAVADAVDPGGRHRQLGALTARLGERDGGGGDVLAGGRAAIALARPLVLLEVERDEDAALAALDCDAQLGFVVGEALADDGAGAAQLDAFGPARSGAPSTDGSDQVLHGAYLYCRRACRTRGGLYHGSVRDG